MIWAAIFVGIGGCEREAEPELQPDFELETERLFIQGYGRFESELCGGTLRWMDDYINAAAPYYDLPPGKIGDYRWYSQERWDEAEVCPPEAGACVFLADGIATAATRRIPYEHELVHMMQYPTCPFILEEGLASFMRGSHLREKGVPTTENLAHLVDLSFDLKGSIGANDYETARHFVSFLVAEHGLQSVLDLCSATPRASRARNSTPYRPNDSAKTSIN